MKHSGDSTCMILKSVLINQNTFNRAAENADQINRQNFLKPFIYLVFNICLIKLPQVGFNYQYSAPNIWIISYKKGHASTALGISMNRVSFHRGACSSQLLSSWSVSGHVQYQHCREDGKQGTVIHSLLFHRKYVFCSNIKYLLGHSSYRTSVGSCNGVGKY